MMDGGRYNGFATSIDEPLGCCYERRGGVGMKRWGRRGRGGKEGGINEAMSG